MTQGQMEAALVRFEQAFALGEPMPELLLLFGDWHIAEGHIEDAFDHWEAARSVPNAPNWVIETASEQIDLAPGN